MGMTIVDPDSGAGYDYTNLLSWEAGQQGELTEPEIAKCRCTGGTTDTATFEIDGWIPSAANYIQIWTDPAESYRHDGFYPIGNKFRLEVTSLGILIVESYVKIFGLAIKGTMSSTNQHLINNSGVPGDIEIAHCIFTDGGGAEKTDWAVRLPAASGLTLKIWNNIAYDIGGGFRSDSSDSASCYIYNNTVHNCSFGFRGGSEAVLKNNIANDCTDNYYGTSFHADSEFNISDTGDAPGTNPINGSVLFADEDGDDFHLDSDDTVAKDSGVDLSTDPDGYLSFSDDIDGDIRSGTWDIGADEYTISVLIITPSPITTVASGVNPLLVLGSVAITPGVISTITAKSDPNVVLGSLSLTPAGINAITGGVDPVVILGSVSITPQALFAIISGVDPIVLEGGDIIITPTAISAVADGVDPQVILGSLSIISDHIAVFIDKNDPDVILGSITITPDQISALVAGQDPEVVLGSITITPAQMSAIIAGIDPTVTIIEPAPELPRHIFSKKINKTFSKELTKIFEASKDKTFKN